MKTQKLPIIILNERNLDFIFDMINDNGYRVGYGENPGIDNIQMKEVIKESLKDAIKNLAICYIEFDPQRKRYIQLTKWFVDPIETDYVFHDEDLSQFGDLYFPEETKEETEEETKEEGLNDL